jgi:hypothetical protein
MTHNLFISYSRRETGFVEDLVRALTAQRYETWLDYRDLVPGTPWLDQIYKGIQASDTILLVVSKASLVSQSVELEWRHVIEQKKRIILLIFEAVDLPPELEKYEWVDFRGSYKAGLKELFSQLEQPIQEEHPVPQTGFKMPGIVWVTAAVSVLVAIYAFSAFWTLFIPWILIPLPYRIFKRNYNFTQVQTSLLALPSALFMTSMIAPPERMDALTGVFLASLVPIFALFFLLRSAGMQRWGKEQATMPKFANLYKPNNPNPKPIPFFVDHAPEDRNVADEMIRVLKKYGHPLVEEMRDAHSVFVLLSRFKSDTEADPETQIVYPVVVQTGDVSGVLSKIQWIDMRNGVRGLNAIAQLLPTPAKLLEALGNRPRGNQLRLPAPISAMYHFLLLLGVFVLGGALQMFVGFLEVDIPPDVVSNALGSVFIPLIVVIGLAVWLIVSLTRSLTRRAGRLASFRRFSLALAGLGVLLLILLIVGGSIMDVLWSYDPAANVNPAGTTIFPFAIYVIGITVMAVFFLFRRRDIKFWFPARGSK